MQSNTTERDKRQALVSLLWIVLIYLFLHTLTLVIFIMLQIHGAPAKAPLRIVKRPLFSGDAYLIYVVPPYMGQVYQITFIVNPFVYYWRSTFYRTALREAIGLRVHSSQVVHAQSSNPKKQIA